MKLRQLEGSMSAQGLHTWNTCWCYDCVRSNGLSRDSARSVIDRVNMLFVLQSRFGLLVETLHLRLYRTVVPSDVS